MSKDVYIVTDSYSDDDEFFEGCGTFAVQLVGIYSSEKEARQKAEQYYYLNYGKHHSEKFTLDGEPAGNIDITKAKLDSFYKYGKLIHSYDY